MSIYSEHMRRERRRSIARGLAWFSVNVGPYLALFVIVGLISWGIVVWTKSNDKDYAGYGPNRVTMHNFHALGEWVGYDAKLLSRKRSHYTTHKAWATQYLVDGKKLCVYVWGGNNDADQSQVIEGACA
jgi:hypothetical protein